MKYTCLLLALVFFTLLSCVNKEFDPDTWDIDQELTLSESGLAFTSEAGSDTIEVLTNYKFFSVEVLDNEDGSSPSWCTVKKEDDFGIIIVSVEPNISLEQRKAKIRVRIGRGTYFERELFVIQMGGQWDVMGQFSLCLSHEISDSQRAILDDLLSNMVFVEGGTFKMGCQNEIPSGTNYVNLYGLNQNIHDVTLEGFYISPYEVTQELWQAFMANNPAKFREAKRPVENISWNDAIRFCEAMSRLTSLKVSLPSEAEWEYAARGGKNSGGYIFPGSNNCEDVANFRETQTSIVGCKTPNELRLYDMAGNVGEYCLDFYAKDYPTTSVKNPLGPSIGTDHVIRGGRFDSWEYDCCSYARSYGSTNGTTIEENTGFRIVIRP